MNYSEVIVSLSYVTTKRVVGRLEQSFEKSFHSLCLFRDRITTTDRTFLIAHVFDLSYRPFSGDTGLFYLHTREGLFAFEVTEEPEKFIRFFKNLQTA